MLPPARRAVILLAWTLFSARVAFTSRSASAESSSPTPSLVALPPQQTDVPWPTQSWPTGSPPEGVEAKLEAALAVVDTRDPKLGETRAVVLVHRGRLVAERYMPSFGPDTPLLSWSMAKSVTQAMVGIAVRRGLVDIDKPMGNPRWQARDPRAAIPWRSWLNMIDGQAYREIGVVDQTRNDAARMLFGVGRLDVAAFAASLPLAHPPATHWNYNSAGVNLIADALGRVFAPGAGAIDRRARMAEVMREELFSPLGMTSAQPEFDRAGTFIGSAMVYATARDWARFGLLYLRGGVWDGRRILPEGWVDFARTKTPVDDCNVYGAGFWLNPTGTPGKPYHALVPSGPSDLFMAQGHEGQVVVVVPSKDLVLVRLGLFDDRKGFRALGEWLGRVVALFPVVPDAGSTGR
jgi:CubicO group peptidase (beta-lactamase class C family)